eukprot:TRINITY_DN7272_c0_g1_i1.p1 TRINITY_DN7272_c0_g1~~TRINITY_DN7272_c0_g1_i1.p1  ORF type:complete len:124 (-),score=17.01 TRINITY_DN7272_c0_g1_i1:32-403(-)
MNTRNYEELEVCIKRATERGLDKKALPIVLQGQKMYTILGKANAELQEANVSGDIEMLENALETARKAGFKGRSFTLATKRIEDEIIRNLKQAISQIQLKMQLGESDVDIVGLAKAFQRLQRP